MSLRRATVAQEGNRLVLHMSFTVADSVAYDRPGLPRTTWRAQVHGDLRRAFPGHRDCDWRIKQHCWSFPLRHRERLGEWLVHWFSADEVRWLDEAQEVVHAS